MSDLSRESLFALSQLCRIELNDQECEALLKDLKRVLDYVELLQEVDVSSISACIHLEERGIDTLRKDEIGEVLERETFLENAPDQIGGMIRIPPVMK